jgi:hypothetical protein
MTREKAGANYAATARTGSVDVLVAEDAPCWVAARSK